ncbi:MAG: hypothetical protein DRH56_04165 [Deltaproteobacteria bacterium]|nr:MAG: hypothetical protein DRH56_04165 [Deltaproteobacteria bacterium]
MKGLRSCCTTAIPPAGHENAFPKGAPLPSKWIKRILILLLVLVSGSVITVYAVLRTYDFNRLKPAVIRAVKEATGRDLALGGDISLSIGLHPALVAEDVAFQNAPWGSRPRMIRIRRLEVETALVPLLWKDIRVRRLILVQPEILLETGPSGRSNLDFKTGKKKTASRSAPADETELPALTFRDIRIQDAKIDYRDHSTGKTWRLALDKGSVKGPSLKAPAVFSLSGSWDRARFRIKGRAGPLTGLADPDKYVFVDISVAAGDATIRLKGRVRDVARARGMDLKVTARAGSLSGSTALLGISGVPEAGPVEAGFRLTDTGAGGYRISSLKLRLGKSDLAGSAEILLSGKRPCLTAALSSRTLDLRPFLNARGPAPAGETKAARADRHPDRVFPDRPIPFRSLTGMDADLSLNIRTMVAPSILLKDLTIRARLKNGRLDLDPFHAAAGGGTLDARINIRPDRRGAAVSAWMKIVRLHLDAVAPKGGKPGDLFRGVLDADLDLHGRGKSVAALMAGLDGRTVVSIKNGRINTRYINLLGADMATGLLRFLNPFRKKTPDNEFNCLVSGFRIQNGVADVTALIMDTPAVTLSGKGRIRLKTETLDLGFRPFPKKGIDTGIFGKLSISLGELSRPLKLAGTLAHPSLAVDTAKAVTTVGKAVGGVVLLGPAGIAAVLAGRRSDDGDPCRAAMQAATGGGKKPQARKPEKKKKGVMESLGGGIRKLFGR